MPKLQDLMNNDVARGVAIGFGVITAAAVLLPAAKPVARAALKLGLLSFEKGRELAVEAGEAFEDLVAEVRAELANQHVSAEVVAETVASSDAAGPTIEAESP